MSTWIYINSALLQNHLLEKKVSKSRCSYNRNGTQCIQEASDWHLSRPQWRDKSCEENLSGRATGRASVAIIASPIATNNISSIISLITFLFIISSIFTPKTIRLSWPSVPSIWLGQFLIYFYSLSLKNLSIPCCVSFENSTLGPTNERERERDTTTNGSSWCVTICYEL
jgi:hypothetical protein